jgi:hypothetical protein
MKRIFVIIVVLSTIISDSYAQNFKYLIGIGLDLDMGIRINDNIAPDHQLTYENSALTSLDVFTKFSYKGFNFTPDFKISWATFGKGKRTAINENGTSMPEGSYISIEHSGDFSETMDREPYLLDRSNVTVNLMNVGIFITHDFWKTNLGNFEAGTGFFYNKKQVNFKEYKAHDIYDYYGSSGSHILQYQSDDYVFKETQKDKKPTTTIRMLTYQLSVPVIIQYNFKVGSLVNLSPAFVAYIGKDSYYEIKFSVGLGNN